MIASPATCGVAIAQKSKDVAIPEIGIAIVKQLSDDDDVHFGVNSESFNQRIAEIELWNLGARGLDIQMRGGRTAENTWQWLDKGFIPVYCCRCFDSNFKKGGSIAPQQIVSETADGAFFCSGRVQGGQFIPTRGYDDPSNASEVTCPDCHQPTTFVGVRDDKRRATPSFEAFFKKFNTSKIVKSGKQAFPANAKVKGDDVSGQTKYTGPTKMDMDLRSPIGGMQYGTRWSKAALEWVVERKQGKVHFHLDGLGDISSLLQKSSDFSHNVTARELRYVWRNWTRFKPHVVFYNGFTDKMEVVVVETPWDG